MLEQLQAILFSDVTFSSIVSNHVVIQRHDDLKRKIDQENVKLEILKAEVVEVLRGNSAFSSILLNDLIQESENKLLLLRAELAEVKEELHQHKDCWSRLIYLRQEILSEHVENLAMLPLSSQQKITHTLISRVELGRDRAVNIEWSFK